MCIRYETKLPIWLNMAKIYSNLVYNYVSFIHSLNKISGQDEVDDPEYKSWSAFNISKQSSNLVHLSGNVGKILVWS